MARYYDFLENKKKKPPYWLARELVVIGVFAALIKVSSLLIALAGGGMNPLSLLVKNVVASALLIVLMNKVPKCGVLTLFAIISAIISLLFTRDSLMSIPGTVIMGMICDGLLFLFRGYGKPLVPLLGVWFFDFSSRVVSLGVSFLFVREEPKLMVILSIIIGFGYLGCLIGLAAGVYLVRELEHAGIIRR